MDREMGFASSASCFLDSDYNWFFYQENHVTKWTPEENKRFENALALFDKDTPDRWFNVAAMIPGKSISDVMKQYQELVEDVSDIEAGLIPIPGYANNPLTLEWVNSNGHCNTVRKRSSSARGSDHERKKGVTWTEKEHRQFLLGLKKYGKGDWRNIANNFVRTRTPTQVASHAQKYFIRQLLGDKDKKRSSIHDITAEAKSPSPDHKDHSPCSTDKSTYSDKNGVLRRATICGSNNNFRFNNPGTTMGFSPPNSSGSTITTSYEGTHQIFGINPLECEIQDGFWFGTP